MPRSCRPLNVSGCSLNVCKLYDSTEMKASVQHGVNVHPVPVPEGYLRQSVPGRHLLLLMLPPWAGEQDCHYLSCMLCEKQTKSLLPRQQAGKGDLEGTVWITHLPRDCEE